MGELSSGDVTFTSGVVSAIRISSDGKRIYQTDAKVSQGSSGGPVLNEEGEVVGVVTFQTETLERKNGDNFAFAQYLQGLKEIVDASRIDTKEGFYGAIFRKVFRAYVERRCNDMNQALQEITKVDSFYELENCCKNHSVLSGKRMSNQKTHHTLVSKILLLVIKVHSGGYFWITYFYGNHGYFYSLVVSTTSKR